MLTKVIGTPTVITMTGTPQTVPVTTYEYGTIMGQTNQNLPATKIRIATNSQPAYVSLDGTAANSQTSVLIPANSSEHFKLEVRTTSTLGTRYNNSTTLYTYALTATISVLQAGSGGLFSVVAVA